MLKLCSMYVTEVVSRTVLVTNENPAQKQRVLVGTSVGIKQRFEPGDPEITSSCEDFWRARGRGWCYIEGQGEEKGRGEACPTSLQAWNESAPTTVPMTIAGASPRLPPPKLSPSKPLLPSRERLWGRKSEQVHVQRVDVMDRYSELTLVSILAKIILQCVTTFFSWCQASLVDVSPVWTIMLLHWHLLHICMLKH